MARNSGFTLLEVVLALLLIALLLFSLGLIVISTQVRMRSGSHQDVAYALAESILERIRDLSWNNLEKSGMLFNGSIEPPDSPLRAGMDNQYPPSPYPRISYEDRSPVAEAGQSQTHSTEYAFAVRAIYDTEYPNSENLLFITVDVYWTEYVRGSAIINSVGLTSQVYSGQ